MIDTNSDPNENGMQIANTASHQSDLGRVHDKQKYTTTNRNTKKVEKTQQKKIVINPFFFYKFANQSDFGRSLQRRLSQMRNDNKNYKQIQLHYKEK